jgi:hypothetical protein
MIAYIDITTLSPKLKDAKENFEKAGLEISFSMKFFFICIKVLLCGTSIPAELYYDYAHGLFLQSNDSVVM